MYEPSVKQCVLLWTFKGEFHNVHKSEIQVQRMVLLKPRGQLQGAALEELLHGEGEHVWAMAFGRRIRRRESVLRSADASRPICVVRIHLERIRGSRTSGASPPRIISPLRTLDQLGPAHGFTV